MVQADGTAKVAVIGTGGTISGSIEDKLDFTDYVTKGRFLEVDELIARFPEVHRAAEIVPIRFRALPSPSIGIADWLELVGVVQETVEREAGLAGVVITHGTATLEETAYFLNLTLKVDVPVVVVGAQRPSSALGTDAGVNLYKAVRVAAAPESRGRGVLVVLNDEIQAARDATKTSTFRAQTFRSLDWGALGHADSDRVMFYRRPERRHMPDTEFDVSGLDAVPRVDVATTYLGSDGTVIRALMAAGSAGLVIAGFPPGFCPPGDAAAIREAVAKGIPVVMSSRAGSGRVARFSFIDELGVIPADDLTPQKARILLILALTKTVDSMEIERIFETY